MGSYFSNLHVNKETASLDSVKEAIRGHFRRMEYTAADAESGDFFVELYAPEDSKWISVCSDSFTHKDVIKLTQIMSGSLDAEVLGISCFDSDYMFLYLQDYKKKLNLWLNIGEPYEMKPPRRSNLPSWKKYVSDFKSFNEAASQDYVCAEDFLHEVEKHLDLPYAQSTRECFEGCEENTEKLYFAAPKGNLQPTKLHIHWFDLRPCIPGQRKACFAENKGAASKGIQIFFVGDYVKNDEITMEDVKFTYHNPRGELVDVPITLEKIRMNNGAFAYYWKDESFNIPEVAPFNLPPKVRFEESEKRTFGIRYTPVGNERKFLDICVVFDPLENSPQGHCWWMVYGYHKTKRDYIEYTNAEKRKSAELFGFSLDLIDPDKYDLD